MPPRIAIPLPHSADLEYAQRAIVQYQHAVEFAGGEPVCIPFDMHGTLTKIIESCDGVLLPGSKADIDPAKFGATRSPRNASADPKREDLDASLLDDAYQRQKPVFGICYGLQSLNVYRRGTLVQHIPDFLPANKRDAVNHEAGRSIKIAHRVSISPESRLATIVDSAESRKEGSGTSSERIMNRVSAIDGRILPVNSSHHQSADKVGSGLRITADCVEDGIIEGLEGTSPKHFVVAVQWHPERSVDDDAPSLALFRAFVDACR